MLFKSNVNGDPRSFFYYKGDFYINDTEITLKDEYIKTHRFYDKKLWKYARYDHQTVYNGCISYFFCASKFDWLSFDCMGLDIREKANYAPYFVVPALELENAIDEITKPIKLEREKTEAVLNAIVEPKSDFDVPGLLGLWVVYIAVLIGSLIFNQFYIIWAIATFLFLKLRKEMRNS